MASDPGLIAFAREHLDMARRNEGLFVGQLDADEYAAFQRMCRQGLVERRYPGLAGFMGLATITLTDAGRAALDAHREEGR
ncbi:MULTISPECIES: hypothetical protein [Methylobacterium]|uniref:MarR family transcriptional regulator n=1 Tax=Methylobacterium jeotgali TaxID=381630 RepID=A0ABQ4SZP7_9HYPH|nr:MULTISPECIES: hypothetical protein [Methylobacterium]PIU06958.1 MAG: hypothetical protein COT56_07455 [Methylobacterium sp. CG09_land_8_20_14_0_10_71_15]PIU16170.1 MAG: hypothetical protein COT28_01775 [Methylobacterium sp. CG08_land_8_20_14_0_20_71_15]GBU18081.1 hypothetical protein AwMethylo_22960 [Methylobacterium sp.]GJE08684.1 hypothetical protein AOPFMNJM_4027 [Methylobacterium jeotgali]